MALVLSGGLVGLAGLFAQAPTGTKEEILLNKNDDRRDMTLLRRSESNTNEFIHQAAKVSFVIPKGWKEIRPQRLYRKLNPRTSTVLGIELLLEREDRDLVASLYWLPIAVGEKLSDMVRAEDTGGEYGEEYETLKAVYGKVNVTQPKIETYGAFNVYKITFKGGPRMADGGSLYLFEVGSEEGRWMIKSRVSYPLTEKNANEKYAEEVIRSFTKLTGAIDLPKEDAKEKAKDKDKE
jgi:hypothetical protein